MGCSSYVPAGRRLADGWFVPTMQCPNCLAVKTSAEARCTNCGRRLYTPPHSDSERFIPMASGAATAPALLALAGRLSAKPHAADPEPREKPAYQPSLFRDVLTGAKVVPIPTL